MTGNEKRVVVFASTAHALCHSLELTYAALLTLIGREFGVGLLFLGAIANAYSLGMGLAAPVGGVLSDRLGSKRMLVVQLLASGSMAFLVAASTSIWLLAVTLTLLGLAIGFYHPVGLSFITRSVRERSLAIGYHGMAGNIGVAAAPALAVSVASLLNWRAAFVLLGLLCLVEALLVLTSPARETRTARAEAPNPSTAREEAYPGLRAFLLPLLAVFGVNMLGGFIYRGTLTFLPAHLESNAHIAILNIKPATLAGYFATIALLFGVGGQYIGGALGERVSREKLLVPIALIILPLLLLTGVAQGVWLVVSAASFAFFNFMAQPIYTTLISDYSPSRLQGSIFGVSFFSAFGLGSFAATFAGYIAQRWGTSWVFISLSLVEALITALALYLVLAAIRRRLRRGRVVWGS
jgi:MFS family permease